MVGQKTEEKKYGKWNANNMQKAIDSVKNNEMGLNRAAREFGVPKGTLFRHLHNHNKVVRDGFWMFDILTGRT